MIMLSGFNNNQLSCLTPRSFHSNIPHDPSLFLFPSALQTDRFLNQFSARACSRVSPPLSRALSPSHSYRLFFFDHQSPFLTYPSILPLLCLSHPLPRFLLLCSNRLLSHSPFSLHVSHELLPPSWPSFPLLFFHSNGLTDFCLTLLFPRMIPHEFL
jgi:hypothetical protein